MFMTRAITTALPQGFTVAFGIFISLRPWQWTKNLLLFLPLIFSMGERWTLGDVDLLSDLLVRITATFLVFCALSGSVYIVNDIFDREQDRLHQRKRNRPIASGTVPVPLALAAAVSLLTASLVGSWFIGTSVTITALVYLTFNLAYSKGIKQVVILDVMVVSSGFILRTVAGALAIDVVASPWLYTTIASGALFLVLGKRCRELEASGATAANQRSVLGQYSLQFLNQLITMAATFCLMAYALYTFSASNVPENNSMMFTVPFVVFGLARYLYILNDTDDGESPESVIIKDVPLLVDIALWFVTVILVLALNR